MTGAAVNRESVDPQSRALLDARDCLQAAKRERARMQAEGIHPSQVCRTLGCAPSWDAIELKIALRLLKETREACP